MEVQWHDVTSAGCFIFEHSEKTIRFKTFYVKALNIQIGRLSGALYATLPSR